MFAGCQRSHHLVYRICDMIKRSSSPMLKWNRGKKEAAKPVAISLSISQMNWWFHAWLVIFIFCFCFFFCFYVNDLIVAMCRNADEPLFSCRICSSIYAITTPNWNGPKIGRFNAPFVAKDSRPSHHYAPTRPRYTFIFIRIHLFVCRIVSECVVCFDLYIHVFVCLVRYVSLLPCHPCHHSRKKTLAVRILHWTK